MTPFEQLLIGELNALRMAYSIALEAASCDEAAERIHKLWEHRREEFDFLKKVDE